MARWLPALRLMRRRSWRFSFRDPLNDTERWMSLPLRILRRLALMAEKRLDAPAVNHAALPTNGLPEEKVRQYLRGLDLDGRDYLEEHLERLVHTIQLVPRAEEK